MTEHVDEASAGSSPMQRTHSHNSPVYQQGSNPTPHLLQSPMKIRSHSNPNIHTIQESNQETASDMPFAPPHPLYSRNGNGYHVSTQSTASSSNGSSYHVPSAMTTPSSSSMSLVSSTMKIKVNFA